MDIVKYTPSREYNESLRVNLTINKICQSYLSILSIMVGCASARVQMLFSDDLGLFPSLFRYDGELHESLF